MYLNSENRDHQIFMVICNTLDTEIHEQDDLTNLDSIKFIKMIVSLETTFNFEFDDEMLLITKFDTFQSIIEYVKAKVWGD